LGPIPNPQSPIPNASIWNCHFISKKLNINFKNQNK
jgi:hypothetical protein